MYIYERKKIFCIFSKSSVFNFTSLRDNQRDNINRRTIFNIYKYKSY